MTMVVPSCLISGMAGATASTVTFKCQTREHHVVSFLFLLSLGLGQTRQELYH